MEASPPPSSCTRTWDIDDKKVELSFKQGLTASVTGQQGWTTKIPKGHIHLEGLGEWNCKYELMDWVSRANACLKLKKSRLHLHLSGGARSIDERTPALLVEGRPFPYPHDAFLQHPYFRSLLTQSTSPIALDAISRATFGRVVTYVWTQQLGQNFFLLYDWTDLASAAHRFGLEELKGRCVKALLSRVSLSMDQLLQSPDPNGGWSRRDMKSERHLVKELLKVWNVGEIIQSRELIDVCQPARPQHYPSYLPVIRRPQYNTSGGGKVASNIDGTTSYTFSGNELMYAVMEGCTQLLPILSSADPTRLKGAFTTPPMSLEKKAPVMKAIAGGHVEVVDFLMQHPETSGLFEVKHLKHAGEERQMVLFERLLAHLEKQGEPLQKIRDALEKVVGAMVEWGRWHEVRFILTKGASYFPPSRPPDLAFKLVIDNKQREFEQLSEVLKMDLRAHRSGSGSTFLHLAVKGGHLSLFRFLLVKQADPNVTDDEGRTPLHLAAEGVDCRIVSELLKANARTDMQDQQGRTPAMVASQEQESFKSLEDYQKVCRMLDKRRCPW